MKKVKIFCFLMLFIVLIFDNHVYAKVNDAQLVTKNIDGVFAVQKYKTGGTRLYYAQMYEMHKDGNIYISYCIELGAKLNATLYSSTDDYTKVNINEDIANYVKLVAYYGYKYSNHYSDKYYLAAQELIWEKMTGDEVYWTTEESADGARLNVDNEKNIITEYVNQHGLKPYFEEKVINYGEKVVLKDKNNVFRFYEIVSSKASNLSIIGGNIVITPTTLGNIQLTMKRRISYTNSEVFYYANGSQNIVSVGAIDNGLATYEFQNNGVRLKINKKDVDTNENIKIEGISFKIYDTKTNRYICDNDRCEFATNKDGIAYLPYLKDGKYKVEEVDAKIDGYLYNPATLEVEVNRDKTVADSEYGKVIEANFYNYKPVGKIIIYKKGEKMIVKDNNFLYEDINLSGVKFSIVTDDDIVYNGKNIKKGDVVEIIETSNDGIATIDNLPLGKYWVIEEETLNNYVLDTNKYLVDIKYADQYTKVIEKELIIKNNLEKGDLYFKKIDKNTKEGLKGVLIAIYDDEDNKIYEGLTDNNGNIYLKDLVYGNYYIKELKTISGYVSNDEKIKFTIDKNNESINVTLENYKYELPPKTGNNNQGASFNFVYLILFILGIKFIKI